MILLSRGFEGGQARTVSNRWMSVLRVLGFRGLAFRVQGLGLPRQWELQQQQYQQLQQAGSRIGPCFQA